jgi:hypothetical protein
MLIGEELKKHSNGDIYVRSYYNFDHVAEANHLLKKEIGDGFSEKREMRHTARIPQELADVDPLVAQAIAGDKVCMRLAIAKYPFIKVCNGSI